jgi:hypothetical protein
MRRLALPVVAATLVLGLGGGLVLVTGSAHAGGRTDAEASFIDPDELRRRGRSDEELKDIEREKEARAMPIVFALPSLGAPSSSAPGSAAPSLSAPLSGSSSSSATFVSALGASRGKERARTSPGARPAPGPADAFALRYGSRVDFNTPSGPPVVAASHADDGVPASAGVKVPVRVVDPIASSPSGPVIAVVTQPTKVGGLTLPSGAALHGQTSGTSGSRVLVTFSFAIVDGKNVPLRGSALGLDGRAGVAGTKSLGGASDVAAGGAVGGAQGAVDALSSAVDNSIVGSAIRGAGNPGSLKLGRMNNEEEIVLTGRGARFFVYVEGT